MSHGIIDCCKTSRKASKALPCNYQPRRGMPLKSWQVAALLVAAALYVGLGTVYSTALLMLSNSCGWAWQAVRAASAPAPPLKAAILAVTSDFHQLAHLVAEFMEQPGVDPAVQQQFIKFLSDRATRSYPRLETALDWLLAAYKFLFPFLIISMVAKLSASSQDGGSEGEQAVAEEEGASNGVPGLEPEPPLPLGSHPSQQLRTLALPAMRSSSGGNGMQVLHRPQLAAIGAGVAAAKATGRAGSQSPRGPETPVDGAGSWLPAHPAATRRAGGSTVRRSPAICEIQECAS